MSEIRHALCIVITQFALWCRLCATLKYILQSTNCHSTDKSPHSRTFNAVAGSPYFPAEIRNRLQIHQLSKPEVFIPKYFLSVRSHVIRCPNVLTYSCYFPIKRNLWPDLSQHLHAEESYFWMNKLYWCRWESFALGFWHLTQ